MIKIKESELRLSFIRSRGPGGQNVNKVSTAVQLKYNIVNAEIPDKIKKRFFEQYKNKISKNGDIIIVAQSYRTQNKNKIDAINRLESLFSDIKIPIKRIPTKPSWSSQVKRVESKKKRSVLKKNRKKVMLNE
ncbi:alternative ribosome rescue aminoacyl-tRNA hydrolase ArfB [Candidatus Marinimicrobia bacterium]|nr:alternative ribosome rescue aminoacyl-tRNA hydrolase ArfB [Candidatus Neomarinimicrobiota bacterium]MDA9841961.1 alternative ribosome rescue aminoacyl-tRNA hydrolase ArfB [Candidatus Neomarinimicrobiota bacterium]MDC0654257.1 alternative ribosome rescue aminoacyl-tRNA hydrolase ArfB [Candidatus Neomarinimicrobiota bacterium]MDC1145384.1 alternative ribosome rescue aminoacyl-tRNA hydrolase ArfB [Candidatus Neomarinimicrobiota bacterium]MDC3287414.1 alternative ribosome rescue aminoacyl-tRNA h